MIIDLPPEISITTRDEIIKLRLEGGLNYRPDEAGRFVVDWRWQDEWLTLYIDPTSQQIEVDDSISPERLAVLQAALDRPQIEAERSAAMQNVIDLAQSAVGVDIRNLSQNQILALLAVVLWDKKAIARDLTIRPLGEWVRRRV